MANADITVERLRELFYYDPDTGKFTQKIRTCNRWAPRDDCGSNDGVGYLQIGISGKKYKCHRLAWLYVNGVWPKNCIDHINGIKTDNRICNLREATYAENAQNQRTRCDSVSGLPGVEVPRGTSVRWRAHITIDGKYTQLGSYDTKELAHAAYLEAKSKAHTFSPTCRY